jgi:hypothetical protein
VQLQSSGCGVRLVARVRQRVRRVDLPTPSITRRLQCLHRRRRPCNIVGRTWLPSASAWQLRASWRLLCPTAHAGELRASWRLLCPTARPWRLRAFWRRPTTCPWQLRGYRLWPTGRSWQLGASWLRPCSILSPCGWHASKLRPCELILRLQTLQPVEVEGQVVVAGPGRFSLVVRKSADAGVVNWKK